MRQASRTLVLRGALALAIGLWAAAVLAGTLALGRYKLTAAAPARAPSHWPSLSGLAPPAERPVLLVFAHPRCACTRATTAELDRLLQRVSQPVDARMVFVLPEGTNDEFLRGTLWNRAGQIHGLERQVDAGGKEAARFGTATSGQALLYGTNGALLFAGGLTIARGHEGKSPGSERILALLSQRASIASAPVFGCELTNPIARGEAP